MGEIADQPPFVPSCSLDGSGWFWVHGRVPRDKLRGAALNDSCLRCEYDVEPRDIFRARVRHGYIIAVDHPEGDEDNYCAPGSVLYFLPERPDGDTYEGYPIIDGPHEATWLEFR